MRKQIPAAGAGPSAGVCRQVPHTAELLLKLLPRLEARGIATLEQATRASRRNPLSRLKY